MERPPAAGEAAACIMSEQDWLTSVIGWMSDAEIREFKLPALSRVHENDPADGRPWTLVKVQALVDTAMSPPIFHGVDSAHTRAVIAAIVEAREDLKASGCMKLEQKSHELKDDDEDTVKQPVKEQRSQDKRSQDTKHWPRGPSKDYEKIDKLPFKGSPDPKH